MLQFLLFVINIIINYNNAYNYTQYFEIVINNIFARNLFKSFNFEIKIEMILRNIFLKFFRYNRDFKV